MHRTEVTEVTEGGTWGCAGNFCRGLRWPGCENLANEECIAQRSRRSQRGDLGCAGNFCRGLRWPGCENLANEECIAQRSRRSQRGTWGCAGNFCRGLRWPGCENLANEECIAQRSRRSQRGDLGVRETFAGDSVAWVRESRETGMHRTEVTEVTEGTWVSAGNFCRGHRWPACENPQNRKASMILRFPARKQFHKTIFNASPDFPLCDLCGLCAMLSPLRVAPAQCRVLGVRCCGLRRSFPPVFTKTISNAPSQFPPSVTSVTSVRCFPLFAWFSHGSRGVHQTVSPATFFLTEAWEKVPQSLVHSQSTILGGHKASLLSHRGLNVLKRIGGTGQEAGIIKR